MYTQFQDVPLIEFEQLPTELAESDPIPRLRIYSSGLVRVHYPIFMKMAGDYETYLFREELDTIVEDLIFSNLVEFDPSKVKQEIRAGVSAEEALLTLDHRPGVRVESRVDQTLTTIRLAFETYRRTDGRVMSDIDKTIRWNGLKWDAALHPQVQTLQKLFRLEQKLLSIAESENLVRVPDERR
jgi:hypothetical protein